jgi:hypothetical protein
MTTTWKAAIAALLILALATVSASLIVLSQPAPVARVGLPGELVYQQGTTAWRLQDAACENEELQVALSKADYDGRSAKAARVHSGIRDWGACWVNSYGVEVVIADHNGVGYLSSDWLETR